MEGIPTIGPKELVQLPFLAKETLGAPAISFSDDVIHEHEKTHILIFTPRIEKLTIVGMRDTFGTDPSKGEPCMYNQDWYLKEDFANTPPDGKWHLARKDVLDEARAKPPEEIKSSLKGENFPSAVTVTFTFFVWYLLKKEILWKHDFLWCSDRDHNGDRTYVGRYEDPDGINKNGFNIHRYLSLRPAYSAAPEIV